MTSSDIKRIFHIEDIMNLPQAVNQVLFSAERDDVYRELIRIHQGDMSYDWFQSLYEQELSQRNQKKQDFTPSTLGLILRKFLISSFISLRLLVPSFIKEHPSVKRHAQFIKVNSL